APPPAAGRPGGDARAAVAGLGLGVGGPYLHEQGVLPLLAGADRPLPPGVVAGGGDVERRAEQAHGPLLTGFVDEAEGHGASRAEGAVGFVRMSRSARRRWFSARRRRSSSSRGGSLPWPGKAWSPWVSRACFQERSRVSWMPRERAASATE